MLVTVQLLQPFTGVAHTHTVGMRYQSINQLHSGAVITEFEQQVASEYLCRNPQMPAFFRPCNAVLDGVFDQGLQQQAGDQGLGRFFSDVQVETEVVLETNLLDIEVKFQCGDFLIHRYFLHGVVIQRVKQKAG